MNVLYAQLVFFILKKIEVYEYVASPASIFPAGN